MEAETKLKVYQVRVRVGARQRGSIDELRSAYIVGPQARQLAQSLVSTGQRMGVIGANIHR